MIRREINQWWLGVTVVFYISHVSFANYTDLLVQGNLTRFNNRTAYDRPTLEMPDVDCNDYWSCSINSNRWCYCDDLCFLFNDCCEDKTSLQNTTASLTRENVRNKNGIIYKEERFTVEQQISQPLPKHSYRCSYDENTGDKIYTVIGCPDDYPDNYVRKNCEQPDEADKFMHVPVSGVFPNQPSHSQSVKFYNLYCAICHGITEYSFWRLILAFIDEPVQIYPEILKIENDYLFSHLKNKCMSSFEPPINTTLRDCDDVIDTCSANTPDSEISACTQGPLEPIIVWNTKYRNIDCAICNNIPRSLIHCKYTPIRNLGGISNIYDEFTIKEFTIQKCDDGSIRDPYTDTCRRIYTPRFCNESNLTIEDPTVSCPDCKLIRLHQNEYISFENYIRLNKTNLIINESLLYYIDNKVYICSEHYITKNTSMETDPLDEIEYYITVIGLSLSILTLFSTFCVYAGFRSLRNVPGKMSMNLVASMFLASLLFIFSTHRLVDVICIVVAVCMHYIYLVSFFWMNALSFDAWNTFSKSTIGGRSKHCYKYYLIYCWITPLLIVSVSIFVQFSPVDVFPSWMSPNYGPPLCWITNKWALLIFFAVPLFLLILCNIVFYILTIRAIYRTEKFSDRILAKKNKGMFIVYLKLCFIMGINWIFALLYVLTGITIIRFISVFLISFQGFWVSCSYLFSKQIWGQLKSKIISLLLFKRYSESGDAERKQTALALLSNSKHTS